MRLLGRGILTSLIILVTLCSYAQEPDTIPITEIDSSALKHSPKKAVLLSLAVPGLGQIYNRKYWKAPIVWAGIGTGIGFIIYNQSWYNRFRNAALHREQCNLDTNCIGYTDEFVNTTYDNNEFIVHQMGQSRLWMEISYIATGVLYILQIVDASVDAHLFTFDVSDDLSLRVRPSITGSSQGTFTGFGLSLNF